MAIAWTAIGRATAAFSPARSTVRIALIPDAKPFGLVLAGGLARRMGGHDKTLLRIDDRHRLLDIVLQRLRPQAAMLAISANRAPVRFAETGLPVVPDGPGPARGPLAGILAGFDHARIIGSGGWMLTVPGDTPFVPMDLAERLAAAIQASAMPVARANCGGRTHPLVALWSTNLREPLRAALIERDLRKVMTFQAEAGVVDVPWPDAPYDPFFNINTPDDLQTARAMFRDFVSNR